jgi:hypothetical protein
MRLFLYLENYKPKTTSLLYFKKTNSLLIQNKTLFTIKPVNKRYFKKGINSPFSMLKLNLLEYDTKGYYDEMFDENNNVRPNYKLF